MRKKWTNKEEVLLAEVYDKLEPDALSAQFGVTYHAVKLKAHKLGLNKQSRDKARDPELIQDYQNGMSVANLVEKYDIGTTTLYRIFDQYAVEKKRSLTDFKDDAIFTTDYVTLSSTSLEEKYGTCYQNIKVKASNLGIKRPKELVVYPNNTLPREVLFEDYVTNDLSAEEISVKHFNTKNSRSTVNSMLRGYGLVKTQEQILAKTQRTNIERGGSPFPVNCYGRTQQEVGDWLNSFGFNFKSNRTILNGKEIDLLDQDLNLGIEYCGLRWHIESDSRDKDYHNNKRLGCEAQGIRLITIFEDEWKTRESQVKTFLQSVIKKNTTRVFARKCVVIEPELSEAKEFIDRYHIQPASSLTIKAFGLTHDGEMIGVMSFGRHPADKVSIVLDRLVFKTGVTVVGGASRLLQWALPWLRSQGTSELISWSDNRWSQGDVYPQLGFTLDRDGDPDYSYADFTEVYKRVSKMSQKKDNTNCPEGMTELEWANERGLHRIWDCGKKRWKFQIPAL